MVLDYDVWYDEASGTDVFKEFASGVSGTDYTATGLTQGLEYTFKVRARNDYGYGEFSNSVSVLAAQTPATPIPPQTQFANDQVTLTWTAPDNGGSPITSYTITIQS